MRWRISIIGVLALFVAVSCDQQPVGPQSEEAGVTLSRVIHDSWVEIFDTTGGAEEIACANDGAGEWVDFTGFAYVNYKSRTTPSGNEIVTCSIDYQTDNPFSFVGRSSLDEYHLVTGEDNCRIITKPKGPELFISFQANEKYLNQDGERIFLRNTWRFMIDAAGEVKIDRFIIDWKCSP